MDTPQIDDFLLWSAGVVAAITIIAGGLVALYRLLTGALSKRLDDISGQLHRNGGSSLRDAVDRIEQTQTSIARDVRDLRTRLDGHIEWHLSQKET